MWKFNNFSVTQILREINVFVFFSQSSADVLANQSELRASSAEKAAYYLDAALASRSADVRGRESHLLFTLHVYQYSVQGVGPAGVSGGRSRLHLLDFGGCERTKTPGGGITLSGKYCKQTADNVNKVFLETS